MKKFKIAEHLTYYPTLHEIRDDRHQGVFARIVNGQVLCLDWIEMNYPKKYNEWRKLVNYEKTKKTSS
jgi:hypothetical protein